ncbi:hypothetical protein [Promicromonospora kroppenstedtii]|uniref:hypothetical protein n=1 Tax=Promicromonospora kroppenstedtii TaxID=440482 RepID=UPI00055F8CDA|nr:hypothetical protein [Promicromonospora kroppenstedtii]
MEINVNDVVTVLEAVGDSWPAAIVLVTLVGGFVAVRALPRLKDITESLQVLRHEMAPNSGKTVRDAVDRIEDKLGTHIDEDKAWKGQVEDLLTRGE